MDLHPISTLMAHQSGVISREQVMTHGGNDNDIARKVRRREWARVHPGVYADHTGPLSREQREWAAVLYYRPAALAGPSALGRFGVRLGRDREPVERGGRVHIAVDRSWRVDPRPGVDVVRIRRFSEDVLANLWPPRLRLEHAVLDVASDMRDESGAVAVLCDAVQSRRTTTAHLLAALEARPRLRHRSLLLRILADVATGAYSVLEREYLNRVERRHSFPDRVPTTTGAPGSLGSLSRRGVRRPTHHRRARRTPGP